MNSDDVKKKLQQEDAENYHELIADSPESDDDVDAIREGVLGNDSTSELNIAKDIDSDNESSPTEDGREEDIFDDEDEDDIDLV